MFSAVTCVLFCPVPNKIGPTFIGTFEYYHDINNDELQYGCSYLELTNM